MTDPLTELMEAVEAFGEIECGASYPEECGHHDRRAAVRAAAVALYTSARALGAAEQRLLWTGTRDVSYLGSNPEADADAVRNALRGNT